MKCGKLIEFEIISILLPDGGADGANQIFALCPDTLVLTDGGGVQIRRVPSTHVNQDVYTAPEVLQLPERGEIDLEKVLLLLFETF